MARILAIDYGKARTGLAWTDPLGLIASPIDSFPTSGLIQELKTRVVQGPVSCIVIGHPRKLDLSDTHITGEVEKLKTTLEQLFPEVEVHLFDERYTSKIAAQALSSAGASRKQKHEKNLINTVSAVLILQGYMQYIS